MFASILCALSLVLPLLLINHLGLAAVSFTARVVSFSIAWPIEAGLIATLIPELKKESKAAGSHSVWRAGAFTDGAAKFLDANPEATVTQAILTQGIGLAEAKEQTKKLAAWLGTLGTFDISIDHAAEYFEFKMAWKYGK